MDTSLLVFRQSRSVVVVSSWLNVPMVQVTDCGYIWAVGLDLGRNTRRGSVSRDAYDMQINGVFPAAMEPRVNDGLCSHLRQSFITRKEE